MDLEELGYDLLYDEKLWDADSPKVEGLETEICFSHLLKESLDDVGKAMRQLIYGDFIFAEHLMVLRSLFTSQPILLFFIWIFARVGCIPSNTMISQAINQGTALPEQYVAEFLAFLLSLDQSNDLPFGLVIGADTNVTVASELRKILNHYGARDLTELRHSLGIYVPRIQAHAYIYPSRHPVPAAGSSTAKPQSHQEVPTGSSEMSEEPPPKKCCNRDYSVVTVAIRILQETGLAIQDISDNGNTLIYRLKAAERNEAGAKEQLYDIVKAELRPADHPADIIEAILDQIPQFRQRFVIRRICQCPSPGRLVLLEGTRPAQTLELALEKTLKRAGLTHSFCQNCQELSKETLASLEGSHVNETDFILLKAPVYEGNALLNCAIGQGIPDFDIPLEFAHAGWSLKAIALHMQPVNFTCVLRYPPAHLYYAEESHQAFPPELPVANRVTLWLLRRVPIDRCIINAVPEDP